MQEIRITDQAVIRLSSDPNMVETIKGLSTHQLENIIEKCRSIDNTDILLESAIWEEVLRRLEHAMYQE